MADPTKTSASEPAATTAAAATTLSVQEATTLLAQGRELQDKLGPRVARMMSLTEDDLKVRSR